MRRAEEQALKTYPPKMEYSSMIGVALNNKEDANIKLRDAFVKGYEQALKDMKETFEKMSNNTNSAIDAVKMLGSLFDNPDIREKLGSSKPIPKKPIKTNPFFGGEKK